MSGIPLLRLEKCPPIHNPKTVGARRLNGRSSEHTVRGALVDVAQHSVISTAIAGRDIQ